MLLRTIRTDQDGKLVACPQCDNEELVQGDYCMICGIKLQEAARHFCGEEREYALQIDQGE